MKDIGLSILLILVGVFSLATGLFLSKEFQQRISLIIVGVFFLIAAVSKFLNRKKKE